MAPPTTNRFRIPLDKAVSLDIHKVLKKIFIPLVLSANFATTDYYPHASFSDDSAGPTKSIQTHNSKRTIAVSNLYYYNKKLKSIADSNPQMNREPRGCNWEEVAEAIGGAVK
ncbi:hypothetical protein E2542_SST13603 [Spatholobus suberectus]|nr:hypothetical protein E2542_SST13603 [Spatholobus suberectus]